ncbi:hypothetical protein DVH24_030691 [Malus domestica]|uniref:Uncharacterized protein n=1 Tax=Malus domestica TaxID=3750 RepID=A0A498HA80_MALDO|nr:hypothetical protein DVH24_030691 [Malus domestica]
MGRSWKRDPGSECTSWGWGSPVNGGKTGSLGDEDEGVGFVAVVGELGVEVDGTAVGEAALRADIGRGGVEEGGEGENVEAIVGSANGGEDDSAFGGVHRGSCEMTKEEDDNDSIFHFLDREAK